MSKTWTPKKVLEYAKALKSPFEEAVPLSTMDKLKAAGQKVKGKLGLGG